MLTIFHHITKLLVVDMPICLLIKVSHSLNLCACELSLFPDGESQATLELVLSDHATLMAIIVLEEFWSPNSILVDRHSNLVQNLLKIHFPIGL